MKVVRPPRQHPVQAFNHLLRIKQSTLASGMITDSATYALNARLARESANIRTLSVRSMVPPDATAQEFQRLVSTSQTPGHIQIHWQVQLIHHQGKR